MGFDLGLTIPATTVFLQGILSFFSPCILPIIPLYMGYLSGGTHKIDEEGNKIFNQKTVFIHTLCFIIGVSFAFFILGLGFSALGQFFTQNRFLFARIGGIVIILLGLIQLGIFSKPFNGKELRLPIKINMLKINPITAFVMGFIFSFAWTPCVGPALSTVLIMISSASSTTHGMILMCVYTIGFTLPFLLLGIFTTKLLNIFKTHKGIVKYTIKIGAVIMILMGLMMLTGTMNKVTNYLSRFSVVAEATTEELDEFAIEVSAKAEENSESEKEEAQTIPAIDFTLEDQFGNIHTLSDYKGKTVFLNIWATWCPPCRKEMPDIEKLYKEYGYNKKDVIILGVAFPNDESAYTQEGSKQKVIDFLEGNNYTYPTVMDMHGELLFGYGISAFPTTFMIDTEGNVFGYVPGMMTYDIMKNIIEQTKNS